MVNEEAGRHGVYRGDAGGTDENSFLGGGWVSRENKISGDHEERGGWVSPNQPTSYPSDLPRPPAGPGGVAKKSADD